jgi:hypothetical protein
MTRTVLCLIALLSLCGCANDEPVQGDNPIAANSKENERGVTKLDQAAPMARPKDRGALRGQ